MDSSSGQKSPKRSRGSRGKAIRWSAISSSTVGCPSRVYFSASDIDDSSLAQIGIRQTDKSECWTGLLGGFRVKSGDVEWRRSLDIFRTLRPNRQFARIGLGAHLSPVIMLFHLRVVQRTFEVISNLDKAVHILPFHPITVEPEELRGSDDLKNSAVSTFPRFFICVFPAKRKSRVHRGDDLGNRKGLKTVYVFSIGSDRIAG